MQPRELELLRLRLTEEVERPFRERCRALEEESERANEACVRARRDLELLRIEREAEAERAARGANLAVRAQICGKPLAPQHIACSDAARASPPCD